MSEHTVAIWSDYICPFCYVGHERGEWLEQRFGAAVTWLPYDLHPEYPPEGIPRAEVLRRYGEDADDGVRRLVEESGRAYAPPDVVPRSRPALEVTELARDRELHEPVHSRLMHAYWSEGANIGDEETLLDLAAEAGLDRDEARTALAERTYADRVTASTRQAALRGIDAVPAFVLDGHLLVLGAQPHELFEHAFARVESAAREA